MLQGYLRGAHTQAAAAAGFAHTYWWVMGVSLVALLPTLLLSRIERRTRAPRAARRPASQPAPARALAEAA